MLVGVPGASFHAIATTVQPGPGAVFLRLRRAAVVALAELTPGEALTLAADLARAARIALAADDSLDAGRMELR